MEQDKLPTLDWGITAVQDDGTNEGIIRAKLEQGELIKVPLHVLDIIPNTNSIALQQNYAVNADGSGFNLNLSVPAGLSNLAFVSFLVKGKTIGIRYRNRVTTPLLAPFSIIVDGVPYTIKGRKLKYYIDNIVQTNNNNPERESVFWIPNLEDFEHTVTILMHASATEARSLVITGIVAEKRLGYQEHERMDFLWGQGTLTSAYTNIANSSTDIQKTPVKGLKEIWYYNSNTISEILYVQYNGKTLVKRTMVSGETYILNLSSTGLMVGADAGGLQHKSDTVGSLLQFTLKSLM